MNDTKHLDQLVSAGNTGTSFCEWINPFRFHSVEILFLLLVAAATVFYAFKAREESRVRFQDQTVENVSDPSQGDGLVLPESSQIMKIFKQRELFQSPPKPPPPPKKPVRKGPGISEKLKPLVLLGILQDSPLQAIVESKRTKETYYIREGDTLFDMEIAAISPDGVTFTFRDESGVLR